MRKYSRLAILFTALAGIAAWTAFGGKDARESSIVGVSEAAVSAPAAAAVPAGPRMPERPDLEAMGADPFSVEQPASTGAAAVAHAAPVAPALPYRFAGRVQVDGVTEVYLAKGDNIFQVKKGETVEGQYRVQKIGRSEMTLVHLASGTREKIEYSPPINEDDSTATAATPGPAQNQAAVRARAAGTAASPSEKREYGSLRKDQRGG